MSHVNTLLNQRLQKKEGKASSKMKDLATQSARGELTTFSGLFAPSEISEHERQLFRELLETHAEEEQVSTEADLRQLLAITAEVKAIHHQSLLLHGERIKRVRELLKNYREGAFTAWLIATYGNRQTPYNFLQYYEFYEALNPELQKRLLDMPRQAIYTLAARQGSFREKERILQNYSGQTKTELLLIIRERFPLDGSDGRNLPISEGFLRAIERSILELERRSHMLEDSDRKRIKQLSKDLAKLAS